MRALSRNAAKCASYKTSAMAGMCPLACIAAGVVFKNLDASSDGIQKRTSLHERQTTLASEKTLKE